LIAVGGSQTNVYLALTADRSLVARVQDYTIDLFFVIPSFEVKEPWARFRNANPQQPLRR
jgi:hypothetical protein